MTLISETFQSFWHKSLWLSANIIHTRVNSASVWSILSLGLVPTWCQGSVYSRRMMYVGLFWNKLQCPGVFNVQGHRTQYSRRDSLVCFWLFLGDGARWTQQTLECITARLDFTLHHHHQLYLLIRALGTIMGLFKHTSLHNIQKMKTCVFIVKWQISGPLLVNAHWRLKSLWFLLYEMNKDEKKISLTCLHSMFTRSKRH